MTSVSRRLITTDAMTDDKPANEREGGLMIPGML
jgi:hypothetical protein